MRVRKLIEVLRQQGYKVTAKDYGGGQGVYITSINGIKYTKSKGNEKARELLGIEYNKELRSQRSDAAKSRQQILKTKKPHLKTFGKRQVLTEEEKILMKEFRKTQKLWRKEKVQHGKIKIKQLRESVAEEGLKATIEKYKKLQRYAQGFAYLENVDALIYRLDREVYQPKVQPLIDKIKQLRMTFKEDWIQRITEIFYEVGKGTIKIESGVQQALSVIGE